MEEKTGQDVEKQTNLKDDYISMLSLQLVSTAPKWSKH